MQLTPTEPVCQNKNVLETFVDVLFKWLEQALKSGAYSIVPSRDVEWQDRRGPLSNNTRLIGSHIQDGLLRDMSMSMKDLMKQEEIIDKDLEDARAHRSMCEIEEHLVWKDYRKGLGAIQASNPMCIYLHQ